MKRKHEVKGLMFSYTVMMKSTSEDGAHWYILEVERATGLGKRI